LKGIACAAKESAAKPANDSNIRIAREFKASPVSEIF
jgi:hypothetical protein